MLIKRFEEQVKKTPQHIAVKTGNKTVTYDELDKYADRIARSIEALCPKEQETGRVGLLLEHGLEMIAAILAALKAGKAYVPLSPDYPLRRISYMLENSEASLLVANWQSEAKAKQLTRENNIRLLDLDRCDEEVPGPSEDMKPVREINGERLAYILYTSGSTGKPKGVMQNHQNVLYFIRNWTRRFSITGADRILLLASFCHDGSIPDIYSALLNGATLYPYDVRKQNENVKISQFLLQEQITIWHSVPSLYNFFANTLTGEENFPDLRCIMLGGEQVRKYEIEMFKKHFPGAILANIYGQTESTLNSIWTVRSHDPLSHVLLGTPLDQTRLFVVDGEGNEVDMLETGEILVASPHISPGYWKNQELTKKSFSRDPEYGTVYWTGDLGRLLPGGNIEFIGRRDSQVKIRGFRVEPGEIETILLKMEEITEAVVVAKESGTGTTYLCAFFTAVTGLNVSQLRAFLSRELPDYMIPLYFVQLEKMPLTQSRKIDRKALSLKEIEPLKSGTAYVEPGTDMEKTVARIWKEVLDLKDVGIHDNIFEVGGNSFDIIKINNELSELLQKNIPIVKLFEYPTIETLAGYLDQPQGGKGSPEDNRTERSDGKKRGVNVETAVIGMAGRFPGAKNIDELWENLKKGVESISFFSDEELEDVGVEPGLLKNPNYVKANGVLEDMEFFDAAFFNFTPNQATAMDPQLRIFHECAWEALEHAGYSAPDYHGLIGVYSGNAFNIGWLARAFTQRGGFIGEFEKGILNNHFSTYISYKLDLAGPSVTMRTACSTSLVAVHMACQGLLLDECDMALAGGVSIINLEKSGYLYQEEMIRSSDGHARAFAAQSSGTVFGDGVGCVVLKRLEDAAVDGDYIYAVIKGSAVNNDGVGKVGYTAPSIAGQREVVRAAQQRAGVEPESIDFIETHGTGTKLGDTVEIEALKQLFPANKKKYCALTSVKSNVGHLNTAAGITGFIKTVLSLEHQLIPPSLHFETPNPEIDFENSPFYVNTKLAEWKNDKYPLRAGVSSFGLGGTNAHVILEEWSKHPSSNAPRTAPDEPEEYRDRRHQLILLSAKTEIALEKMTTNLVDHLKENPDLPLADAAYTLQVGRKVFPHRRMLVGPNVKEVTRALSSPGSEKVLTFYQEKDNRSAVFMFPGLGAQYVNMGLGLYQSETIFRQEMDRCFRILDPLVDEDIKGILYPRKPGAAANLYLHRQPGINQPGIEQLVIFIVEYSLARLLNKWGIMPRAIIGYSFGEYVAACIAGVFSLEDALKLVVSRGRLIRKIPVGAMSTTPLPREELEPLLDNELSIAIDNGSSCVVSGPRPAVDAFEAKMKKNRYLCMRLPVSRAIHSKMMEPILEEFKAVLRQIPLNKPQIPYISNVTGTWIKDREAVDPEYWSTHLKQTVKFADGLAELVKEPGSVFLEVGPGHELSALLARQPGNDRQQPVINLVKHPDRKVPDDYFLLSKIGLLWLYGIQIDWSAFYLNKKRYRIPLPAYPFERKRYWPARGDNENFLPAKYKQKKPDIADWFYLPQWERSQLLPVDRRKIPEQSCWLIFIDESVFCSKLVERLARDVNDLVTVVKGSGFQKLGEQGYRINPTQSNDYRILLEELQKINQIPHVIVHLWSLCDSDGKILEKEIVDDALDSGLYSILYLVQAINQQASIKGIDIHIILNGIHEVTGEEIIIPQNAAVIGLTKVIPQEYNHINCRCIDIELPEAGSIKEEKLIKQLLVEFQSNSIDSIVAYRLNYRWVQTFKPIKLKDTGKNVSRPGKGLVYLIIGGLGNIGFTLAKYLAATVGAKLILTGRTELPPGSEWEKYLDSHDKKDPAAVNICRMLELKEMGSEVTFFSADAADYQQMLQVITESEVRFGKINGVIHAAASGASANRTIDEIGKKEFQHQFQAKVYGLIVLEKLFGNKELDFCLLISSPASILGGLGHAAYAAANQFIDTFVYRYNRIHLNAAPWITVNWGDWLFENEDNGDSNIPAKDPLAYLRMTPEQGIKTFQKILNHCPVNHVVVSAVDLQERINDWVRLEFKQEKHKPGKNISTTVHTRPHLLTPYVAPGSQMEKILSDIWREHLGIEKVGINDNFFELGVTSLDIIQLNRKLKDVTRKDVHIGIYFRYPNIRSLALHLSQGEKQKINPGKEMKRSDKVQQKRKNIQSRTKIRKNTR